MPKTDPITGTIIGVRDCGGSIVIVFLDGQDGQVLPVVYDHRMFRHLLEGEGCEPDEVMGRQVSYDGDSLVFLDERNNGHSSEV